MSWSNQQQGGWGGQQQQGGWSGQQQVGWGGQQQGTFGVQQQGTFGVQQQGAWGTQPQTQFGGQQQWGQQQRFPQGTTQQWGGQGFQQVPQQQFPQGNQQWGGQGFQQQQQPQQKGGFLSNLFGRFKHNQKPNKLTRPYYSIASQKAEGRVFDICQDQDPQRRGKLIIWQGYAGPNQSFGIIQQNNRYLFKCKQPHGYLSVSGPQDGAFFYISNVKRNQSYFDFRPVGDRKYVIVTCFGKAMDIYNQNKNNGTMVIQWPIKQKDNDNQIWMLMDPKNITSSSDQRY